MDSQHLSHSDSYAYSSEEWPEFYDLWVESMFGAGPAEDASVFRSALEKHIAGCNSDCLVNVVDIGTGTGRVIKDLCQQPVGGLEKVRFWGLDIAQAMLDRAKTTFDALEAARHLEPESGSTSRPLPTWIAAPAADFASSLPNLVGNVDLIIFAAGGITHLTADDEAEKFLEQVHQMLRPRGEAIISVLHEMIPEKNPNLAVEQEQRGSELPSSDTADDAEKIPSRDHPGITYIKSPSVTRWSPNGVRTDSFSLKTIKDAKENHHLEQEVLKEKAMAWSMRVFDEKIWGDAVSGAGLQIKEVREGEIQRWYALVPSST
ncbi:hypothetical protein GP486_006491 [Trichoglossum hirsutum]|uniref:Methyltransferase type 12 domain-containing protein n=1 Tax=Trichoglossum hirsutum TaxID=265104 RepID=A0A9P8IH24_9PEZI|nr:hypothetical protein GP486_006491 [Trichoglossum hirsutum]